MNTLTNLIKNADSYLSVLHSNPYVSGSVGLFLVLYAGMAAPKLPAQIAGLFENSLFKLLILSMVLVVRNYNPTLAILVAVGFVISMNTLSNYRIFAMANELDSIISSPTLQKATGLQQKHSIHSGRAEEPKHVNGAVGGTHGTHGDMKANQGTSAGWLNGMSPEGLKENGYDGDALASYGMPGSQI